MSRDGAPFRSFGTTTTAAATAITIVSGVYGLAMGVDVELRTRLRRLVVYPTLYEEGLLIGRSR